MKKHRLLVTIFASLAIAGWSQNSAIIVESYSDGQNSNGFTAVDGKWSESSAKSEAPGLTATKSVFNDANAEAATARFTPDLPAAGKYEVFMTYPVQGNASNVKYKIVSADGENDLALTQFGRSTGNKPAANEWYSLGVYNFQAGNSGYVEVSDPQTGDRPMTSEPNARIYADSVKFVPVSDSTPVTKSTAATAGEAATAAAPGLPPATPAPEVAALPSLPGQSSPAQAAPQPGNDMPGLPAATPAPGLPALPSGDGATPANPASALPGLPTATPAGAGLPALPSKTPAGELPSLPAGTPAAPGLPPLPAGTPAPAQGTPASLPNLPSLAPVTPTPVPQLPSVQDTPVPTVPAGMPGGALSSMTPYPMPDHAAGVAVPTPISAGAPLPAAGQAAAQPTPAGFSISTYNPSNLPWMFDFGAALNVAREQHRKVLVFFTAEHNKAAQSYENEMFSDPVVREELKKYILVKSDFPRNTRLAYSLGVFGAGIIAVVDDGGRVTARVVQKPDNASDLLTQLSAEKAVRATPAPEPQGAAGAPGTNGAAAPSSGTETTAANAPADGAAPGMAPLSDATPVATPGVPAVPDMPAAPALPASEAAPAGALPGAPNPAGVAATPSGPAAEALPALPGA